MVAEAYHFSMHKLLAVLGLLALPLSAQTYEARSPHHRLVVEAKGAGQYAIQVTDLDTKTVLLSSMMKGEHYATNKTGDYEVKVHAGETRHVLTVSAQIDREEETVDLIMGVWLTAPRRMNEISSDVPFRVGGDVKAPVLIHRVEAAYTEKARNERIEGIVIIEATIDRTGHVRDARVLKPLPDGLDQAAVDAVQQWTFAPGTLNGAPVDVLYNVTVNFRLK